MLFFMYGFGKQAKNSFNIRCYDLMSNGLTPLLLLTFILNSHVKS